MTSLNRFRRSSSAIASLAILAIAIAVLVSACHGQLLRLFEPLTKRLVKTTCSEVRRGGRRVLFSRR